MASKLPSHLHQNRHGIYGYRVVVPVDLRVFLPRTEIRISLRTQNKNIAKRHALLLTIMTNDHFDRIRSATSVEDALALGKEFVSTLLKGGSFDDETAILKELLPAAHGDVRQMLVRLIALRERQSAISVEKKLLVQRLTNQLQDADENAVDMLTCEFYADATPLVASERALEHEVNQITLASQQFLMQSLHDRELTAQTQKFDREKEQLSDFVAKVMSKAPTNARETPPLHSRPTEVIQEQRTNSELLTAVVEAYCQTQVAERNWTAKTSIENGGIFDLWIRIVGDRAITTYGYEQHRAYKAALLKLPPNLNKNPRYRECNLDEILAFGDPAAAPNTINKSLTRVASFFKWACAHGYSSFSPVGMTIKNPKRANEERKAFNDDELGKLFSTREYRLGKHKQPYMHWAPLLALYTGARLNEIAQLALDDFQESSGISVISINDQGEGKRLKTAASKRLIPIHPELVRLGLLRHVEKQRKQRQTRLFPELKLQRDGYGQTVSKWFARYCDRCGISEQGKVFHSFRHTVIDHLKQAGIAKDKIAALVGHEDDSVTFGRYGKDFQPNVIRSVVETLKFDVAKQIAS